jgi:2-aminoethylphosphonate-pyruvate transaminase
MDPDYLLLTPGPLSTTATVRAAMDRDVSTWDVDYNSVVEQIRNQLVSLVEDIERLLAAVAEVSGRMGLYSEVPTTEAGS